MLLILTNRGSQRIRNFIPLLGRYLVQSVKNRHEQVIISIMPSETKKRKKQLKNRLFNQKQLPVHMTEVWFVSAVTQLFEQDWYRLLNIYPRHSYQMTQE